MNVCIGYNYYKDKDTGEEKYIYHICEDIEENGEGSRYIGSVKSKTKLDIEPFDNVKISFKKGQYGWYINDIRKEKY